jgi:hypothetical protein
MHRDPRAPVGEDGTSASFEYRGDWGKDVPCPYCGAGRREPCRSKVSGETVSPHNARLYKAIEARRS